MELQIEKNLTRILNEKGITQRELAERLNCTESAISKYVNGKRVPNITILSRICKELNVNINELLKGEEV